MQQEITKLFLGFAATLTFFFFIGLAAATFYSGSSDTDMQGSKITNLGTPSASTDAATKGYVDNASGSVFRGVTSATVTGSFGYLLGANSRCDGNYTGSHICLASEIIAAGETSGPSSDGWVVDDVMNLVGGYNGPSGAGAEQYSYIGPDGWSLQQKTVSGNDITRPNCKEFSTATSTYYGVVWDSNTGRFELETCNSVNRIACCGGG